MLRFKTSLFILKPLYFVYIYGSTPIFQLTNLVINLFRFISDSVQFLAKFVPIFKRFFQLLFLLFFCLQFFSFSVSFLLKVINLIKH